MISTSDKSFLNIAAACLLLYLPNAARADVPANVSVNITSAIGVVPVGGHGVNACVNDRNLNDPQVPRFLKDAGINAIRYPGGDEADKYHWQSNISLSVGGTPRKWPDANSFDGYMAIVKAVGATPVVTVNYGSNLTATGGGDPAEAAAWVAYSKSKGYGVKYWEIGNEQYDNGEYKGALTEQDLHADHSPTAYGQNVLAFASAMKAQDPSIKVGVELCQPGQWPEGLAPDWNLDTLSQCGKSIDFVIIHWYPAKVGKENDATLLATPTQIAPIIQKTRSLIDKYCGANAPNVQILITEMNSVPERPGKQTTSLVSALFVADATQTWLENGVANVDYWQVHGGMWVKFAAGYGVVGGNLSESLYGATMFGDDALLSTGRYSGDLPGTRNHITEPPDETPFPSYYGNKLVGLLETPGDTMLSTSTDMPLLSVHAVKTTNGGLALLLINKSPTDTYAANINLHGLAASWKSSCTSYFYGESSTDIAISPAAAASAFTKSLPPYSITALVADKLPPAPLFNTTVSVSPAVIAPNATSTISASVTNSGQATVTVGAAIEVHNLAGDKIAQQSFDAAAWKDGATRELSFPWTAPAQVGTYTVSVRVGDPSANATPLYTMPKRATVIVAPSGIVPSAPSFTSTVVVNPAKIAPGVTASINVTLTDIGAGLDGGVAIMMVKHPSGNTEKPQVVTAQSWAFGQTKTYSFPWTPPTPILAGTYTVIVGVANQYNWKTQYYWENHAGTFEVTDDATGAPAAPAAPAAN